MGKILPVANFPFQLFTRRSWYVILQIFRRKNNSFFLSTSIELLFFFLSLTSLDADYTKNQRELNTWCTRASSRNPILEVLLAADALSSPADKD